MYNGPTAMQSNPAIRLLMSLLALAVLAGCETKTPAGPAALPTTTSTTTTSIPLTTTPTTSSSTTTTIVLASLARRYVAFNPPANTPSEMTLFFELLTGGASGLSSATAPFGGPQTEQVIENRYRVTGVYIMPNGTTGNITGILGGSSNPLETGGDFTGTFTATTATGCTAQRPFAGRLNPQTLQFGGTEPGTATCSPSPLAIPTINMLRSDPAAPIPTPPTTTSVTTTTTTTILCTYALSPTSATVESAGGSSQVAISAPAECAWSAQSFADWVVVRPPYGGAGSGVVVFDVQPNPGGTQRSATLLIAGIQFTVVQGAPLPDLAPDAPGPTSCVALPSNGNGVPYQATIAIRNLGIGDAPASGTRIEFDDSEFSSTTFDDGQTVTTPALGGISSGANSATHQFAVPGYCWRVVSRGTNSITESCLMRVSADYPGAIPETSEANNVVTGTCTRMLFASGGIGALRPGQAR
jgi:hypothetical protein